MPTTNATGDATSSDQVVRVQPATIEDLGELVQLVGELMSLQADFTPNTEAHERGLSMILEQPKRGRIFVLRSESRIFGMANLLFTISTAMGGMVIVLEDFIIHPDYRGQGFGSLMIEHVVDFAEKKGFKRITLLADKLGESSQNFFKAKGFNFAHMVPMRRVID
ncbi:MAG: GNAT family N-acetyltransferase [Akkermansiaceae bacterium]